MREELGINTALSGPVYSTTNQFEHEGVVVENTDVFFFAHCNENAPALGAVNDAEREAITTMRWWTLDELDNTTETIFPADLSSIIRAVIACNAACSSQFS